MNRALEIAIQSNHECPFKHPWQAMDLMFNFMGSGFMLGWQVSPVVCGPERCNPLCDCEQSSTTLLHALAKDCSRSIKPRQQAQ